jgi:hypothetical protein
VKPTHNRRAAYFITGLAAVLVFGDCSRTSDADGREHADGSWLALGHAARSARASARGNRGFALWHDPRVDGLAVEISRWSGICSAPGSVSTMFMTASSVDPRRKSH